MKKLNKGFYRREITVTAICILLFALPFALAKCRKGTEPVKNPALREFTESPVYKEFLGKKHVIGKVDIDAARVVRVDNSAALVHIPVMQHRNVEAAIIGIPLGRKGEYELMYQDNKSALSGTGNIDLYTSANELFAKINLKNGVIQSLEPSQPAAVSGIAHRQQDGLELELECGYWCRVKKCYAEIKKMFPGEMVCDILDIFMGVCTMSSVATCLIKAAK